MMNQSQILFDKIIIKGKYYFTISKNENIYEYRLTNPNITDRIVINSLSDEEQELIINEFKSYFNFSYKFMILHLVLFKMGWLAARYDLKVKNEYENELKARYEHHKLKIEYLENKLKHSDPKTRKQLRRKISKANKIMKQLLEEYPEEFI